MGRTKKPCPGCGEVSSTRSADQVCYQCSQLMEDGRKYRALTVSDEREYRKLSSARHHLPYIHYCSDKHRYAFQQNFLDLARLLSLPTAKSKYTSEVLCKDSDRGADDQRSFPVGVPGLMENLFEEARWIAHEAYEKGVKDGQGFIANLAAGHVSVEDFNKATINDSKKRR